MSRLNIDQSEVNKFSQSAAHWWDLEGEFKTLHQINPLRLSYIMQNASLNNQKVLDIGCGGGILSESMAKAGAIVTAIDMSEAAIDVAKLHQFESGTTIEYLLTTAEAIAEKKSDYFDVVTCLELLKHVPDPSSIVRACAKLVKPGGHVFFSTINRNIKSYLLAIIGAEYLLKLLPHETHDFAKFIRPSELSEWARDANLTVKDMIGIHYNLFTKEFSLNKDVSVNYMMHLIK